MNEERKNLERIERLSFAVYKLISRYRDMPNVPDCQHLREFLWREYEDTAEELKEAMNG